MRTAAVAALENIPFAVKHPESIKARVQETVRVVSNFPSERGIAHDNILSQPISQVPYFCQHTPKEKPSCAETQKGRVRLLGLEPRTYGLKVSCSTD